MLSKIYFRTIFYLFLLAVPNLSSAQCFPATAVTCNTPENVSCDVPSDDPPCKSFHIDRILDEDIESDTSFYAPDSKIICDGIVATSKIVSFYAGESITFKEGFLAVEGSLITAKPDPATSQFSPIDINITDFDDRSSTIFNHEDIGDDYGFVLPIRSPVVECEDYTSDYKPNPNNLYFFSLFGPRYLTGLDFHGGADIVERKTSNFEPDQNRDVICMCEGEVVDIDDPVSSPQHSYGKFIKIRCKEEFNNPLSGWQKEKFTGENGAVCEGYYINIAYRHLESIEPCIQLNMLIKKGDKIGTMGNTGAEVQHLHLSVQRKKGFGNVDSNGHPTGFENVHPMRIFRPTQVHLLKTLDNSAIKIYQLKSHTLAEDEAFFRFVVPYDQIAIRYIQFTHRARFGNIREWLYDFEDVSIGNCTNVDDKNDPNCISNMSVYPYPFNRGKCAYGKYLDKIDGMTEDFPASPLFNGGDYFPILKSDPFDQPNYVLDVVVKGLSGLSINNLEIRMVDIYGYGIKANAEQASGM